MDDLGVPLSGSGYPLYPRQDRRGMPLLSLTRGSTIPIFDTNEPARTHFVIEIPIHPVFIGKAASAFDSQLNDQEENQLNHLIIDEIQKIDTLIKEDQNSISDQDTDQDTDQENRLFIPLTNKLLEYLLMISVAGEPSSKILDKYGESALAITKDQLAILKSLVTPKSNKEIQEEVLGLKTHTDNFKKHIEPLVVKGFVRRTIPNKPTSKLQKYFSTERGRIIMDIREKLMNS